MVTKQGVRQVNNGISLILAKIHMVTKRVLYGRQIPSSLILAKIHMVTKPQIHVTIYSKIIKY